MKFLISIITLVCIVTTAQAKEFCGLLNLVSISKKSNRSVVRLYNKEFASDFITISNEQLAQTVVNKIQNEVTARNEESDLQLKPIKALRADLGQITYADWYYKFSKLKYFMCVQLSANVKRSATVVRPYGSEKDGDTSLVGLFVPSINKSVYTPAESLQVLHNGVDIDSDDYYEDAYLVSDTYASNIGYDEDFCYKGQPRDLVNYMTQNDGRPFWYYDEGEDFESAKIVGNSVQVTLYNAYSHENQEEGTDVRSDYLTTATIEPCQ